MTEPRTLTVEVVPEVYENGNLTGALQLKFRNEHTGKPDTVWVIYDEGLKPISDQDAEVLQGVLFG